MLEILVFLPLVAALVIGLGAPARVTAIGAAAISLALSLILAVKFSTSLEGVGTSVYQFSSSRPLLELDGFPSLALAFGLDGISLVLVLLATIVLLAAVLVSPKEGDINGSARLYYLSLLLIGGGAIGAFASTDLFFLYAFHELALIPTFLMIGIFGKGENRVRTAWTITIYLGVGSLILLVGLIMLVSALGGSTFSIELLSSYAKSGLLDETQQTWIFGFLLVGFGILVSLFPFHSWAAPAYAQAPAPVAMLHAGVLKKFGLYGLIRVALPIAPAGMETLLNILLVLLLGNIIYVGLVTLAQKRLDDLLGYSSVMHMGYVFLGIAALNPTGLSGAVLLMFAHGVSIALLFALCGWMERRFGTLEFEKLGGIATHLPKLAFLFALAAFASAGLPGFANFAAEISVFFGAFKDMGSSLGALQWTTIIALWGVVITAVYMLRALRNVFFGTPEKPISAPADITLTERLPIFLLVGVLLAVGFMPELLNQFIRPGIESLDSIITR